MTALEIPAELLPVRRAVRLRPGQDPPRGGRGPRHPRGRRCSAPRTGRPRSGSWSAASGPAAPSCSGCPTGYEVVLGNGGSTTFWDVAVCSLIERRSAHASFGEFSAKFAAAAAAAPHLDEPRVVTAAAGSVAVPTAVAGRRRLRLGPQRDLDRGAGPGPPGRRRRRGRPGRRRRHLGGGRGRGGRRRDRRLLLRPAEEPGLRRRAVVRAALPRRRRADRADRRRPTAGSPRA